MIGEVLLCLLCGARRLPAGDYPFFV